MKTLIGYAGLGLLAIAAVIAGSWLGLRYKLMPFTKLPGIYDCGDFGIPQNEFRHLEIDPDFKVFSEDQEGMKILLGNLRNYDGKRGRLEMTMDVVHGQGLTLDPLARNLIEGTTLGIRFVQIKDGHESSGAFCKRLRQLEAAL